MLTVIVKQSNNILKHTQNYRICARKQWEQNTNNADVDIGYGTLHLRNKSHLDFSLPDPVFRLILSVCMAVSQPSLSVCALWPGQTKRADVS